MSQGWYIYKRRHPVFGRGYIIIMYVP